MLLSLFIRSINPCIDFNPAFMVAILSSIPSAIDCMQFNSDSLSASNSCMYCLPFSLPPHQKRLFFNVFLMFFLFFLGFLMCFFRFFKGERDKAKKRTEHTMCSFSEKNDTFFPLSLTPSHPFSVVLFSHPQKHFPHFINNVFHIWKVLPFCFCWMVRVQ